jgi:hypothetical protein
MRALGRLAIGWGLALAVAASPALALDAPAASTPPDRSAELFREGRQLLAEGRLREACEKFDQSLELRRSPGTLLNVGSCRAAMGDLIGAVDAFGSAVVLAEREPPSAKVQAQIEAGRRELDAVRARVAHLTLQSPPGEAVEVVLDGKVVNDLGVSRPMNPGLHRIEASGSGTRRFELDLVLKEGEVKQITIPPLQDAAEPTAAAAALSATPVVTAPPAHGDPAAVEADAASPSPPVPTMTWVLLGTGGALLLGSAVTGLLALDRKSDLEDECPNDVCPEDYEPLKEANTLATTTDVLLGVGLASAGAGVAFWLFADGEEPDAKLSADCASARRCGVRLRGRF